MESLSDLEVVALVSSPDYNQAHLFPEGQTDDERSSVVAQLKHFDRTYPGGILNYIQRAKKLLADSAANKNPFEGFRPDVPDGEVVNAEDPQQVKELEALGLAELSKCAFVLVAGGLGERLGYNGIKVSLPVEVTTQTSYLELYIQHILAYQERTGTVMPFAIMTSDDTHSKTVELLESHNYFGMDRSQLTLMKQQLVPAILDNEAKFEIKNGVISGKPHGHGDVHTLLYQHGLPQKWTSEGKKWLLFFQDTNILAFTAFLAFLGVSAKHNFEMHFMTYPRVPKEASGGIMKMTKGDQTYTLNVEYNQIEALLKESGWHPDGDVDNATLGRGTEATARLSPFPGNTNILLLDLHSYLAVLEQTGGAVPEFVNPKYADAAKTTFKSATRLECMMQDFARLFPTGSRVGFTLFDSWFCFSAAKNSLADARIKASQSLPLQTCGSAEADYYLANAKRLQLVGAQIGAPVSQTFSGLTYEFWPKVVIKPSFAISIAELEAKLQNIEVSSRSALVLEGRETTVKNLRLDGALFISKASEDLTLTGETIELVEADDSDLEVVRIRGYKPNGALPHN